jgi:hypothetical protein
MLSIQFSHSVDEGAIFKNNNTNLERIKMSLTKSSTSKKQSQKLLRHVVLFSWKDDTPQKKITEIENAFALLPSKIKEIEYFEWGTDISVEGLTQGFIHCFLVTFRSEEDRNNYLTHPEHEAFVERAKPYIQDVLVLDYWQRTESR